MLVRTEMDFDDVSVPVMDDGAVIDYLVDNYGLARHNLMLVHMPEGSDYGFDGTIFLYCLPAGRFWRVGDDSIENGE